MYVAEEAKQKSSIAYNAWLTNTEFKNLPENMSGASTKTFLTHCLGRINLKSPLSLANVVWVIVASFIYQALILKRFFA
jgi:hypothetical protein